MVANIFGTVRPIQNGRWNCEQVKRAKDKPQPIPKWRVTPRLIKHNDQALRLARTRRTEACMNTPKDNNNEAIPITCSSNFEFTNPSFVATQMVGVESEASSTLPMKDRGTTPGKVK